MVKTKITVSPNPVAVSTFFEHARKVHIPRKKANNIFSTKIALIAKFKYYFSLDSFRNMKAVPLES